MSEKSAERPNRYAIRGKERLEVAPSRPFPLPQTYSRGHSNYFSDSFLEGFSRRVLGSSDAGSCLEGATMPNGQKYEVGLKDKEGWGEDGENSGPS
jgi:hypothetical protein